MYLASELTDIHIHIYGLPLWPRWSKNLSAVWETWVPSLGWEDPLEKGKATHSSILAWRIPRTVQSMGSQRVRHNWATFTFIHEIKMLAPWKKWVKVSQSCLTLCHPMNYTVRGILQARILEWVAFPFSTGIFPTQESNPGLQHCRWILYQLSYQGSPQWNATRY